MIGEIISNKEEKEYNVVYEVKVKSPNKYKNSKIYIQINKKQNIELVYGEFIKVKGKFIKPSKRRNENGFDYSQYLKTKQIYGTVKVNDIEKLKSYKPKNILKIANDINLKIKEKIFKVFPEQEASIIQGLLLGDTSKVEEDIQENFRLSNIIHILAVSGMHVSYIIIGIQYLFGKIFGKKSANILTLFVLSFYMIITGFSPSIVRAGIMGIISILSKLIYRRTDISTSISFSLLLLLLYNPFLILNKGLQLSYLGTIGIILFQKNIFKYFQKIKNSKQKIKIKSNEKINSLIEKWQELLSVTIAAQIILLPIMIINYNYVGIYFFITNILVSIIVGPILIFTTINISISFLNLQIAKILSYIVTLTIKILICISSFGQLPFSKIYVPTPKIWQIVLYYIFVMLLNIFLLIKTKNSLNYTQIRIKNLFHVIKFKFRNNRKRCLTYIILFIFLISILKIVPKDLNINFIDVGQGDSTFIITPRNKTILIDGGGSISNTFDVGEKTLLPFILDKGYTNIDVIIISHFDQDHIGRNIYNY